jgi:hypothetical protein
MKDEDRNRFGKERDAAPRPLDVNNQEPNDSRGKASIRVRHFAERIGGKSRLLRFVCEAQPLIVLTIHDLPKRCPLCSQNHPIPTVDTKGECKC